MTKKSSLFWGKI